MTNSLVSSLFSDMQKFRREVDSLFDLPQPRAGIRGDSQIGAPAVSVGETHEDVRVWAFAPGLDEKSIDVSLQGNLLRIAGAWRNPASAPPEQARGDRPESGRRLTTHRAERNRGRFSRLLTLPESVDPNQVHAWYRDGVLGVTLAKKPEVRPRRIEIAHG